MKVKYSQKYSSYQQFQNIKVSSDLDNANRTFELCIYNNNKDLLDSFGLTKSKDLLGYMLREKAEFALRLLEKWKLIIEVTNLLYLITLKRRLNG